MTILQLIPYYFPALSYGGPVKVVAQLNQQLIQLGHKIIVLTTDSFDQNRRLTAQEKQMGSKQLKIIYSPNLINSLAYRLRFFSHFLSIFQFLKISPDIDIIHIHDIYILPQLIIALLTLIIKKPYLISPHGVLDPFRTKKRSLIKKILSPLVKLVLVKAKKIIATSDKEAEDLKLLGFKNIAVINNGVKVINKFKKATQLDKKIHLLYIGKLHPHKGLKELVTVLAQQKIKENYLLTIAGPDDGQLMVLKNLIKKYNLDNINLLDFVNEQEKKKLYQQADIFIYPSYSEGFSISILEAMNHYLPVLITKQCNFPEIKQKKAGWIIDASYLEAELSSVLNKLNRYNKRQLAVYGFNANKIITKRYSIRKMAQNISSIYEQII